MKLPIILNKYSTISTLQIQNFIEKNNSMAYEYPTLIHMFCSDFFYVDQLWLHQFQREREREMGIRKASDN